MRLPLPGRPAAASQCRWPRPAGEARAQPASGPNRSSRTRVRNRSQHPRAGCSSVQRVGSEGEERPIHCRVIVHRSVHYNAKGGHDLNSAHSPARRPLSPQRRRQDLDRDGQPLPERGLPSTCPAAAAQPTSRSATARTRLPGGRRTRERRPEPAQADPLHVHVAGRLRRSPRRDHGLARREAAARRPSPARGSPTARPNRPARPRPPGRRGHGAGVAEQLARALPASS